MSEPRKRPPGYYWYRDPAWAGHGNEWSLVEILASGAVQFIGAELVDRQDEIEAILGCDLVPVEPPRSLPRARP